MTTIQTPGTSNNPQSLAQKIFEDTTIMREQLDTILALARATALPMDGEEKSFIETVTILLQMIVAGIESNRLNLEALHQRFDQPGIAMALRRMAETD